MTAAIPLFSVPICDKNGAINMAWQRFFLSLAQGGGTVNTSVGGKSGTVGALNFGAGFTGTISGQNVSLSTGLNITDEAGQTLTGINTLDLSGNFGVTSTGNTATISAPNGAVQIAQGGVIVDAAAEILNFTGNAFLTSVGDVVYISVGTEGFQNGGTSIGSAATINAGTGLSAAISGNVAEFDFTGIPAQQGTTALGSFTDLDIGAGLVGTMGTGSLAGTISLSGTGLEFFNGTTSVGASLDLIAGTGATFTAGTEGVTLDVSGGGGGALIIENGGTSIGTAGTLNAGTGTTLSITGTVATITAPGGSGSGVTYGGELVTSIVAGSGTTMMLADGALTVNATGGGGGSLTVTSSSTTLADVDALSLTNFVLTSTTPGVEVQASYVTGSGPIVFPAASSIGNTILLFVTDRTDIATPAGWTLKTTFNSANSGFNAIGAIFSKAATGTTESISGVASSPYGAAAMYEITGSPNIQFMSAAAVDGVLTIPQITQASLVFGAIQAVTSSSPTFSAPTPSSAEILEQISLSGCATAFISANINANSGSSGFGATPNAGTAEMGMVAIIESTSFSGEAFLTAGVSTADGLATTLTAGDYVTFSFSNGNLTINSSGGGGGGGGLPAYANSSNTSVSFDFGTSSPGIAAGNSSVTIPAATVSRTFAVSGFLGFDTHGIRTAILMDATNLAPGGTSGFDWIGTGDGFFASTLGPIIVVVPGDGATHTFSIVGSDSGSTGAINVYNQSILATQIA